jgi:DNA-damage-inducible protein D
MNEQLPSAPTTNTFERIKRVNQSGAEFWSSRDFAQVLGYTDYRNFEAVVEKARTACFSSGQRAEDHFVEINEMIEIGKGGQRSVKTVMLSRYAGYLVIQNADPAKAIVALGQTYFAIQTRRQELADAEALQESQKRLLLRAEMKTRNKKLAGVAKQSLTPGCLSCPWAALLRRPGIQGRAAVLPHQHGATISRRAKPGLCRL